jgi:hypothetical protein
MSAETRILSFDGEFLRRGFWVYVWQVVAPGDRELFYVGRTGDSSSRYAQSPFNRMGQHLGFAKNSNMLRKYLGGRGVEPNDCEFRLVAHGPLLDEAGDLATHRECRDTVAGIEKALAEAMLSAGYDVMNIVRSRKPLDRAMFAEVLAAFAVEFPRLRDGVIEGAQG